MSYYLVTTNVDADGLSVYGPYEREELEEKLKPESLDHPADGGFWGPLQFFDSIEAMEKRRNDDSFTAACVIKGKVVMPRPVELITRMELP